MSEILDEIDPLRRPGDRLADELRHGHGGHEALYGAAGLQGLLAVGSVGSQCKESSTGERKWR